MSLTNLTSRDIGKISKLIERKETLQTQLAEIDQELASIEGGGAGVTATAAAAAPARRGRAKAKKPAGRRAGRTQRGGLRDRIVEELKAAGGKGVHVKELSERLGVKDPNIRVWFYSTGKNFKEIKQVAPATYAWVG